MNPRYPMKLRFFRLAVITLLLPPLLGSTAAAAEVAARLEPVRFTTDEPARLLLTVTGARSADFKLPDIDGLEFHRRGTSTQFQIVNGTSSSSVIYTILVRGLSPGSYRIPPIEVEVDGRIYRTTGLSCTVAAGNTPKSPAIPQGGSEPAEAGGEAALVRLEPAKTTLYVGEVVPATVTAYFKRTAQINLDTLPRLHGDGLLLDPLSDQPRQYSRTIDGTPYTAVTWDTALTGVKTGSHRLNLEVQATMRIPVKSKRQLPGLDNPAFQDPFFDNFFTRYQNRPIRAISPTVNLEVKALPEQGRPENFSGAVGDFSLELQAEPTSDLRPGDPIMLEMTVQGSGNFGRVFAPTLTDTDGLKSYTPSSEFRETSGPHQGGKHFEQAVVIQTADISQIPPVAFSYFDPDRHQYLTLFSDPVPLQFAASSQGATSGQAASPEPALKPPPETSRRLPGLAPQKEQTEHFSANLVPLFARPWYLATGTVILTLIVLVAVWRWHRYHHNRDPELIRERRFRNGKKQLLRQLERSRTLPAAGYLETVLPEIKQLLADRWQTEAGALTAASAADRLGPEAPLARLLDYGDRARFGNLELNESQKEALHRDLVKNIIELQ